MRHLVETHPADQLELVDGVKILDPKVDGWILVLPDAGEPLVHIYANSEDRDWVDEKLNDYRQKVLTFIEQEQGIHQVPQETAL